MRRKERDTHEINREKLCSEQKDKRHELRHSEDGTGGKVRDEQDTREHEQHWYVIEETARLKCGKRVRGRLNAGHRTHRRRERIVQVFRGRANKHRLLGKYAYRRSAPVHIYKWNSEKDAGRPSPTDSHHLRGRNSSRMCCKRRRETHRVPSHGCEGPHDAVSINEHVGVALLRV